MEWFTKYYGSDWVGMTGTLLGLWYMCKQRKRGFLFGSIGCVGWMTFGILTGSIPSIVANVIYLGMNFRGWCKWKENPPQNPG